MPYFLEKQQETRKIRAREDHLATNKFFYYWSSMRKISVMSKKTVCFQNKRTKTPETLWYILKKTDTLLEIWQNFQIRCAIWYYLYNLKNVKNTHGGVLTKRAGLEMTFLTAPLLQTNNLFIFNLQWYINH